MKNSLSNVIKRWVRSLHQRGRSEESNIIIFLSYNFAINYEETDCIFWQNFHTRKFREITVFYTLFCFLNQLWQTVGLKRDCNRSQTENHLVRRWTLYNLPKLDKWSSCFVSTYLYVHWLRIFIMSHARLEWICTLNAYVSRS